MAMFVTRGDGKPVRQPVEITVLDAVARGVDTVPALAEAVGEAPQAVETAVAWAAGRGFVTRMQLAQGEHIAITELGLASVAGQRRLEAAIGPDGQIDMEALNRQASADWQAAQEGRAAALARSQAHVLVDDAEREAAVAALREEYAQGAIDLAELERRTGLALSARTRGELGAATVDLVPATPPVAAPAPTLAEVASRVAPLNPEVGQLFSQLGPAISKGSRLFMLCFFGLVALQLLVRVLTH